MSAPLPNCFFCAHSLEDHALNQRGHIWREGSWVTLRDLDHADEITYEMHKHWVHEQVRRRNQRRSDSTRRSAMSARIVPKREMVAEDIGMFSCRFVPAYSRACGKLTSNENRICLLHTAPCAVCGELATSQCSYCGQFVCGTPLCDDCEGWEDNSKSSGSWGFMNHSHRRKSLRRALPADLGLAATS